MNAPRTRRLALVPLTALAVTIPALPALASTSYQSGCTVANVDHSASIPNEAPLTHTTDFTSLTIDPQAETMRASARSTFTGLPSGEACDVLSQYRDKITVVGAGLPVGTPVQLTAVVRLVGDLQTTGAGDLHSAEAQADATFSLRKQFADFGEPELLYVTGDATAHDRQAGPSPDDESRFSHDISVQGTSVDSSFDSDLVDGVRAFDTGTQTVIIPAAVGDVLDVTAKLGVVAVVYDGTADARSTVDEFSVKLSTSTPGVVLDRGDGQTPPPPPPATALDEVQEARALLASYGLPKGMSTALGTKLAHAERDLAAGAHACDDLTAFTKQVAAQRGKKLTTAQADALSALAASASTLTAC